MEPTQTRTHTKHHKHSVKATFEVQLYSPTSPAPFTVQQPEIIMLKLDTLVSLFHSLTRAARLLHCARRHLTNITTMTLTSCWPGFCVCGSARSDGGRAEAGRGSDWGRGKWKGEGGRGSVGQSSSVLRLRGGRWGNMCSCLKEEVKERWRVCACLCVYVCVSVVFSHTVASVSESVCLR